MKLHRQMICVIALALATGCATTSESDNEKDEAVTLSQVPAAVQQTIKGYASEAEIKKIEKGDVDGKVAYEFEIQKGGKDSEVAILPNGQLLGTEEIISLPEVPEPARKTIDARAAGGKVDSVEKVVEKGKTVYEAVIEKGGKKVEITVAPDGKLLGTEAVKKGKD